MSDRFAYSAPPGAHSGGITRRGAAPRAEARSADSKQGQDDTERSEVSACIRLKSGDEGADGANAPPQNFWARTAPAIFPGICGWVPRGSAFGI